MAAAHETMAAEIAAAAVQVAATLSRIRSTDYAVELDRADVRQRLKSMRERIDSIEAGLQPQTPAEVVQHMQRRIDAEMGGEVVPMRRAVAASPETQPEPPRAA